MKIHGDRPLATGQIWKTRAADIEILGLGKRLIHYRITKRLGHKRFSAQLCGIDAMANYLRRNAARLVAGPSKN
jgi:hypothetical protein